VAGDFRQHRASILTIAPFPVSVIEPDVRISRIRLSDWFHGEAHDRRPTCSGRNRDADGPKTCSAE